MAIKREEVSPLEEVWKDIDGFPGYQVSSYGRIRSFRNTHGCISDSYIILKPRINKDGYYELTMNTMDRKQYTKRPHRLVAIAFLGPHPGLVVNHIDGNKLNNKVENLEWVTAEENSTKAAEAGLYRTKQVRIVETGEVFNSFRECAKTLKTHPSNISDVTSGKQKTVCGLHLELVDGKPVRKPFLYDYQLEAVNNMKNGCILCGSVGSGKSRTGLFYYFKENGGWIDEYGYVPMKRKPQDLIVITTAKKRDSLEWNSELCPFLLVAEPGDNSFYGNKVIIDSWNCITKYQDREGCFFLLDEQRLVGSGAWVKAFLKIAKKNNWILLSATPGDSYHDYLPVFLANGFFRNKTEFNQEHVVFARYAKFPKIERYINTTRLDRLRDRVLVQMNYSHQINKHNEDVYCNYDIRLYKDTIRNRWNYYTNEPITDAGGLCYNLRRIVNSDESRQVKLLEILEDHPRAIIFYSFNYELEILRNLGYSEGTEIAEWNGTKHQPIPESEKWVYLVQYTAGCEGWQCIKTDTIIFYSQNYSYKVMTQAAGRIDRLNTPFTDLYYYHIRSRSGIDLAITKALQTKKNFNEKRWTKWDN